MPDPHPNNIPRKEAEAVKKRLLSLVMATVLLLSAMAPTATAAANRTLTVAQAETLALYKSAALKKINVEVRKKQVELKEAREAVRETRRRENSWSFSLLFSIKAPEKHDMPKEMDLLMAIPQVQYELQGLNREAVKVRLEVLYTVKNQYMEAAFQQRTLENKQLQLRDAQATLKRVIQEFAAGRGEQADVEFMETRVRDLQTDIGRATINFDKAKDRLSTTMGLNVRVGYRFQEYLLETDTITLDEFDQKLMPYAEKNDFDLYTAIQARKLSEIELDYAASVFGGRYSKYASSLMSFIRANRGTGQMDVDLLQQKYEATLEAIDKPWQGAYKIRIIFFTISIPKEWFMKRFTGLRYLGDEKYILMLAAVNNDQAVQAEEQAYIDLRTKLRDTYDILREMEFSLRTEREALAVGRTLYDNILKDNRMGLATFADTESKKVDLQAKEDAIYALQVDMSKTLAMFNYYTLGYLDYRLGAGAADTMGYGSGSLNQPATPQWTMNDTVADYKFEFGVINIPEELTATHFELYDNDGQRVGERVAIDETIAHLPLTYSGSSRMVVKLFAGNKYIAWAELDGSLYGGDLELNTDVEAAIEPVVPAFGIFQVKEVSYRGEMSIVPDSVVNYDSYAVFYEGRQVGERRARGDKTTYVAGMFRDMNQIEVALYLDGTELVRLGLKQTGADPISGNLVLR